MKEKIYRYYISSNIEHTLSRYLKNLNKIKHVQNYFNSYIATDNLKTKLSSVKFAIGKKYSWVSFLNRCILSLRIEFFKILMLSNLFASIRYLTI